MSHIAMENSLIEFVQMLKSQAILEGFKELIPQYTVTVRDGKDMSVKASELVCGDLIELKAGDKVPADVRIFTSNELKVCFSSMTRRSCA